MSRWAILWTRWKGYSMIEPCVPFSFIDEMIEDLEEDLEDMVQRNEDRESWLKISGMIDGLKLVKRKWYEHDR